MNLSPLSCLSCKTASLALATLSLMGSDALAQWREPTFTPSVTAEMRYFPQSPAYEGQLDHLQPSLVLGGEGRMVSKNRRQRLRFEPFLRLDGQDSERTHFDLRELSYSHRFSDFDLLIGNAQVFWGVAESRNVVDVINQFDTVENSDETDKLGQPLIRLGTFTDFGRLEAYYLPYFRERTFPGADGRQRGALRVDEDAVRYERDAEEFAGDFALRYKHQFDAFDVGAHLFYGTSRNPFFEVSNDAIRLNPVYQELSQGGIDVQWTQEEWLLKYEGIVARSGGDTYFSSVAGFEYTFFDVAESGRDLGVLMEGLLDNRDPTKTALSLFDNDLFVGSRLTWNDVEESALLVGAIVDWETDALIGSVEYETRLMDTLKLEIEAQLIGADRDDPVSQQDRDSNVTLRLIKYF